MPRRKFCAKGQRFNVGGLGEVIFRGRTPSGWPLFHKASDPPYFGKLVAQGRAGDALNAAVDAYERGTGAAPAPRVA